MVRIDLGRMGHLNVTWKHITAAVTLLATSYGAGITHIVRTEIEFSIVKASLVKCEKRVDALETTNQTILNELRQTPGPPLNQGLASGPPPISPTPADKTLIAPDYTIKVKVNADHDKNKNH